MTIEYTGNVDHIPNFEGIGVYAIKNKKNGKYYIGSTVNVYNRFAQHARDIKLKGGINEKMINDKSKSSDYDFIILDIFSDNQITGRELLKYERHYMALYNSISDGYNIREALSYGAKGLDTLLIASKAKKATISHDRISLAMPKDKKEELKAHVKEQGETLSGFINRAISETIQRDNIKHQESKALYTTSGKTEYKNKYAAENYDRVGLMLPKGTKDIIKSAAQKSGNSINSYIYAAISDKLTADGFKKKEQE